MTNSKSTKRALLTSSISLLLCFAMLLGTTFAWFTDSVTSMNNIIRSGNLDVELWYWNNGMDESVNIESQPDLKLFRNVEGEEILWEPGATGFGQFEVKNEGTLALKYKLMLKFANATATPEGKSLADVLSVYAVSRGGETGDDAEMEDAALENLRTNGMDSLVPGFEAQPLKDFVLEGYLLPGESFTYELGVFWEPTDNDNDYNVAGGLSIDFGVTLVATQMTYEKDSYDEQYDKDSEYLIERDVTLEENSTESVKIEANESVDFDLNSNVLNSNIVNNGAINIENGTIDVDAAGLENYGKATLTNVTMNAGSTKDYSNISNAGSETTYNNVNIDSAGGGIGAVDGANVVFNSGSMAVNSASTSGRYLFYAVGNGTVITINGGEFSFSKTLNQKRAYIYAGEGATVYVTGGNFGPASTRSGYTAGILGDGTVIITGGTFGFDPSAWVAEGYTATELNGTWTVSSVANS